MRDLFKVHRLNEVGMARAFVIAEEFSKLLDVLEVNCAEGRDMSLVRTKLQEASFFAKQAMATMTENQEKP